jgi:hypothetical protein
VAHIDGLFVTLRDINLARANCINFWQRWSGSAVWLLESGYRLCLVTAVWSVAGRRVVYDV